MSAPSASRYPPNRPDAVLSTAERARRAEYRRDNLAALARGVSLEARAAERERFGQEWGAWLRQRMDACDVDDPVQILPDALARLEQIIDDRVAVAIKEFKTAMKGALK
jgi:hypothetical protein